MRLFIDLNKRKILLEIIQRFKNKTFRHKSKMAESLSNIKNNLFWLLPYFLEDIFSKVLTIFQYFLITFIEKK